MGQGRQSALSRIFAPRKAKKKDQARKAASAAKHKKEMTHLAVVSPGGVSPREHQEALASVIAAKQKRIVKRAQMCAVDQPFIAVKGSAVLLPNTTYPAAAATFEDEQGEQRSTWRLGDGGVTELVLLGVDPRSLQSWMDAFSTSRIRCVIPGQPGPGAPIFARARVVQRTTESGRALQPVHEATKALAMAAPSFVAPVGHVSQMGEMLQGAVGFVRDSALAGSDMGKHSQGTSRERKAAKTMQSARHQVASNVGNDDFGMNDVNVTVGIAFSIAGSDDEQIGRGLWSFANRHSPQFQRVMTSLWDQWSGS